MSRNLKTLKVVAPHDGELLLPTDYGKPGRLNSMGAIRSESARVYRRVCEGRIPVEEGTKLCLISRDALPSSRPSLLATRRSSSSMLSLSRACLTRMEI
jgi:hypothetical protein